LIHRPSVGEHVKGRVWVGKIIQENGAGGSGEVSGDGALGGRTRYG